MSDTFHCNAFRVTNKKFRVRLFGSSKEFTNIFRKRPPGCCLRKSTRELGILNHSQQYHRIYRTRSKAFTRIFKKGTSRKKWTGGILLEIKTLISFHENCHVSILRLVIKKASINCIKRKEQLKMCYIVRSDSLTTSIRLFREFIML